jgi:hypothetical protein
MLMVLRDHRQQLGDLLREHLGLRVRAPWRHPTLILKRHPDLQQNVN